MYHDAAGKALHKATELSLWPPALNGSFTIMQAYLLVTPSGSH
jgi:hypothetical protein